MNDIYFNKDVTAEVTPAIIDSVVSEMDTFSCFMGDKIFMVTI